VTRCPPQIPRGKTNTCRLEHPLYDMKGAASRQAISDKPGRVASRCDAGMDSPSWMTPVASRGGCRSVTRRAVRGLVGSTCSVLVGGASFAEQFERRVLGGERCCTRAEIERRSGVPRERTERLWPVLDFADVGDDEVVFTDDDVGALQLMNMLIGSGLLDPTLESSRRCRTRRWFTTSCVFSPMLRTSSRPSAHSTTRRSPNGDPLACGCGDAPGLGPRDQPCGPGAGQTRDNINYHRSAAARGRASPRGSLWRPRYRGTSWTASRPARCPLVECAGRAGCCIRA
jgi:hypothetical protein